MIISSLSVIVNYNFIASLALRFIFIFNLFCLLLWGVILCHCLLLKIARVFGEVNAI